MGQKINPIDRVKIQRALIISIFALVGAAIALIVFSVHPLGTVPAPVVSIILLALPLLWLFFLLFDTQILILDDSVEAELWASVYFGWRMIQKYPKQIIQIQQIPAIGEYDFPYQQLILKRVDGRKDVINLLTRSFKDLKKNSTNAENLGLVKISDVSEKEKLILGLFQIAGLGIILLFGLFATYIFFVWIQGFL